MKRFNLRLSDELFEEVERMAKDGDTTSTQILRSGVKLMLELTKPGTTVFLKEDGVVHRVIII